MRDRSARRPRSDTPVYAEPTPMGDADRALPGDHPSYFLDAGYGARHRLHGHLSTRLLGCAESDDLFDMRVIEGGRGATLPTIRHAATHLFLYLLDGTLEVTIDGEAHIVTGDFAAKLLDTASGKIILFGLALTIAGIIVVAMAGAKKDQALSPEQKAAAVAEFDFRKGLVVAIFAGIMSACFAFGLAAGEPIKALSAAAGTGPLWTGLPVLCLVMFGGLLTNAVWCTILIVRNRSASEWLGRGKASGAPILANLALCALAGTAWYFQFFFYTMGESQMGRFGFSSWTLHMASIIIFGTL